MARRPYFGGGCNNCDGGYCNGCGCAKHGALRVLPRAVVLKKSALRLGAFNKTHDT
ncbi:MAG: hypothetical protein ACR2P5_07080 [Gammaproteobacteria bacterium]